MITVYVFAIFELANIIEPGAVFKSACMPLFMQAYLLNGDPCLAGYVIPRSFLFTFGITAIAIAIAEVCARIMRPAYASTTGNPLSVCSPSFIVNNIPFVSLNSSIALGLGLQVTLQFLKLDKPPWYQLQIPSLLLIAILATNKLARKHVVLRLRQYFDVVTIGGHNVVSTYNVVTIGRNNTSSNASSVSTIVVPVREQPTKNTLMLVPPKGNSLCPVGE